MWNSINKFLEGLFVGSIVGYVFGLLSAPKSGAELRKELADNSEDLYNKASDSLSDIKSKTGRAIQDAQSKGSEVIKKATATVQEKKDQLVHKFDEMAGQSSQVLVDDGELHGV